MPLTLLIARHGNTFDPGDTVRRVGARTDLPLSTSGIAQAANLGRYLQNNALIPSAVYTSELQRAKQTAQHALQAMRAYPPVTVDSRLNELDYGPDENQPEAAVIARLGKPALEAWEEEGRVPEGWLVDPAAIAAAWQGFAAEILQRHQNSLVMVVTSNGTARYAPALLPDIAAFRRQNALKLATAAFGLFRHDGKTWSCDGWNIRP